MRKAWLALVVVLALFAGSCAKKHPDAGELRVPPGFRAGEGATPEPYTNTGWAKEIVHEKTGVEMVFIPAGEFMMGSPAEEKGRLQNEGPVQRVRITKPFYMGKHEVVQSQWQEVIGSDPSHFGGSAGLPVETVSWDDCQRFLHKAGNRLRLPTEAQWEYACRAGARTRFSFGNDEGELGAHAWYGENGERETHDVGQKKPNAWGLYDMHGNLWEWCADWYDDKYCAGSPANDPQGPNDGVLRVFRGGSWGGGPGNCRSARRSGGTPDYRTYGIGFRLSLDLK
jgi:formylglycine-generating enzyme required for sulfatase activity